MKKKITYDSEIMSFSLTEVSSMIVPELSENTIHEICKDLKMQHNDTFLDMEREAIKNCNSIEEIEEEIVTQMIYDCIWKLKINQRKTIGDLISE
jgi:hypothetical protein